MKPYYRQDGITIFNCDCREYFDQMKRARAERTLALVAAKSPSSDDVMSLMGWADWESEVIDFDLCLTDPPYGIGENSKRVASRGKLALPVDYGEFDWDREPCSKETIELIVSQATHSIIWGGNFFIRPVLGSWLVWDKLNSGDFADAELAWTNLKQAIRVFRHRWNGMIRDSENDSPRAHPTQKPIALMKWCLGFAPDAKTVIDPFMGSGSVLVAAKHRGLTAVGIDQEERYCEIAAKRLSQGVLSFQ